MIRSIAFLLVIVASPALCLSQVNGSFEKESIDYFSPKNVLGFADNLFENGDYERAAGEYRRFLFLTGSPAGSDSTYYRMIKALFLAKEHQQCLGLLDRFGDTYPGSSFHGEVDLLKSIVVYHQHDHTGSLALATRPADSNAGLQGLVVAMNHLHLGDYDAARESACRSTREAGFLSLDDETAITRLCRTLESTGRPSRKSRVGAGLLSAVIPGAGKIYCGRKGDGLYALLVIGLTAWQSYEGFDDDGTESVKGWVLGTLGAGFYLGNIYGSTVCADIHNRHHHDDFIKGLRVEVTLP